MKLLDLILLHRGVEVTICSELKDELQFHYWTIFIGGGHFKFLNLEAS
jgi:hypothetical protein